MVFSLARNFLRDTAAAEELAQEVFLELYQHLKDLQSPAHVNHWLRKVATRRCIDHARRWVNRPKMPLHEVPEPSSPSVAPDPWLSRSIQNLVSSLPAKQRMVVVLRFQEDMDPAEIAGVLAVPVNSVKSCLHRSLALLRQKLEKLEVRS